MTDYYLYRFLPSGRITMQLIEFFDPYEELESVWITMYEI